MKKCYSVFNPAARQIGAIGIFYDIRRLYFATDEAEALAKFGAQFETSGPPSIVKEIESPFDSDCLFDYANNTEALSHWMRSHVESFRRLIDRAARELATANQNWHDDKEAGDHELFQATSAEQFPREMRDAAVLDLVKRHLEVINENERAQAARESEVVNAKS